MNTFYCLDICRLDISFQNSLDLLDIKGSKFLSYLFPLPLPNNIFESSITTGLDSKDHNDLLLNTNKNFILQQLRDNHKKAVHFVWAFRLLNEYEQIVEGSSDDGEPKGSSGVPMLEVMRGEKIINTLCVCVRYFGGTKLGVGGLVRAYTQSSLNAISVLKNTHAIKIYKKLKNIELKDKSSQYNKIVYLIQKYQLSIVAKEFYQSDMILTLQGEEENIDIFLRFYKNI